MLLSFLSFRLHIKDYGMILGIFSVKTVLWILRALIFALFLVTNRTNLGVCVIWLQINYMNFVKLWDQSLLGTYLLQSF